MFRWVKVQWTNEETLNQPRKDRKEISWKPMSSKKTTTSPMEGKLAAGGRQSDEFPELSWGKWSFAIKIYSFPVIVSVFLSSDVHWCVVSRLWFADMLTTFIWSMNTVNIVHIQTNTYQWCWGYLEPLLEKKSAFPMVTMATEVAAAGLSRCCPVDGWLHYCTTACCVTSSWAQQWHPPPIQWCVFAQVTKKKSDEWQNKKWSLVEIHPFS